MSKNISFDVLHALHIVSDEYLDNLTSIVQEKNKIIM